MMVDFKTNSFFNSLKDIHLREGKKLLKIHYGGTGDLYFDIFGVSEEEKEKSVATFEIEQESEIYPFLEKLYTSIINHENKEDLENLLDGMEVKWYSDEIYDEKANVMTIRKENDKMVFSFFRNPDDHTFGFGVRICNSGSKYEPINLKYMDFYNSINNDIKQKDKQKQIHRY